jgi:cell division protein FtsZ
LVNITAGPDFSIDEFETVGNAVKAFASENATVVVGTVIDMEMSDELRVTVVATGIGAEKKPDISLVSNRTSKVIADSNEFKLQANGSHAMPSASAMPENAKSVAKEEKSEHGNDLEYLDIPAFLRKQAD